MKHRSHWKYEELEMKEKLLPHMKGQTFASSVTSFSTPAMVSELMCSIRRVLMDFSVGVCDENY